MTDKQSVIELVARTEAEFRRDARAYVSVAILHVRSALAQGLDSAGVVVIGRYAHVVADILCGEYGLRCNEGALNVGSAKKSPTMKFVSIVDLKAWRLENPTALSAAPTPAGGQPRCGCRTAADRGDAS